MPNSAHNGAIFSPSSRRATLQTQGRGGSVHCAYSVPSDLALSGPAQEPESENQRVSSPAATGGAGTTFEQHVGAYWLAQLLVRGIPPVLTDTVVAEVSFQTERLTGYCSCIVAKASHVNR